MTVPPKLLTVGGGRAWAGQLSMFPCQWHHNSWTIECQYLTLLATLSNSFTKSPSNLLDVKYRLSFLKDVVWCVWQRRGVYGRDVQCETLPTYHRTRAVCVVVLSCVNWVSSLEACNLVRVYVQCVLTTVQGRLHMCQDGYRRSLPEVDLMTVWHEGR